MTGIMNAWICGAGGIATPYAGTVSDIKTAPTTATGSITFAPSGSTSYIGSGTVNGGPWFIPPSTSNPGNYYWIKFHDPGATNLVTSGGLVDGTVYALSATRTLTWTATSSTKIGTVNVTFYSDAAGTQQVGTGTLTVDVESA